MKSSLRLLIFIVIFSVIEWIFIPASACAVENGLLSNSSYTDPANLKDFEVDGDPAGNYKLTNISVYGFSQVGTDKDDPQVYLFRPDINLRAWQKWDIWGTNISDYYQNYINNCHPRNILFIAGGTMSVVFRNEASNNNQFMDWATRDAKGNLVEHSYISRGAYRCSLANPAYRVYLVSWLKKQIDLGVDGLFLDELNAGYTGGTQWNWNGNEGFDDYFIRDFNWYLMVKYPDYTANDWRRNFKMTPDNIIRRDIPYFDIEKNFNYRKYLQKNGWESNPHTSDNPLSSEWGRVIANRINIKDGSFTGKYMNLYIKQIVSELRKYAREKYSKEILLTANGIFPWMDFNSLGLYNGNNDDNGKEADYVPVLYGHLVGYKSLKGIYLKMLDRSRETSGNAPLVMFMDWPCPMINGYYHLPLSEKKDFWRIYAAEAYACGLYFAFHLRSSMPDEPTASVSGIMDFLKDYSSFYKKNADIYMDAVNTDENITVDKPGIEYNLAFQPVRKRYLLHLINHNYNRRIIPQTNITITFPMNEEPSAAILVSPDRATNETINFKHSGKDIILSIDKLEYYDILVIE